jgi:hypothetical protein
MFLSFVRFFVESWRQIGRAVQLSCMLNLPRFARQQNHR